jgi:hypothetical protein
VRLPERVEPSLSATSVVRALPDGEWLTEAQIVALDGVAEVLAATGRPLKSALGEARRRGWVIRNPARPVIAWTRTPKGTTETLVLPKQATGIVKKGHIRG